MKEALEEEDTIMVMLRSGVGRKRVSWLGCAYTLGLSACAGQATPDEGYAQVHNDLSSSEASALRAGVDCDSLLDHLQGELREQVKERAARARVSADYYYYGGGAFIDDSAPLLSSSGAPGREGANLVSGAALSGFSETTVQVQGVDEGDFVKAEGDRIYLIHGSNLFVLGAQAANATEVLGTSAIEGQPSDLFVRDGKVLVFSYVYGPLPGTFDPSSPYYYYYPSYTKLTVLDAASGTPAVLRESYVEGNYVSSRRHDGIVRAVVSQGSKAQLDYPSVSYVDIFGRPRSQAEIDLQVDLWVLLAEDSIESSIIEDYLPSGFERVAGQLVPQPIRCGDYWLPGDEGLTQAGSTDLVTFDLDAPQSSLGHATVLGYAERVYANDDAIILSQTDYDYDPAAAPTTRTLLHRFDLDGAALNYTASGRLTGYIQSQFSLDEAGGVIRASTTEDRYGPAAADAGQGSFEYLGAVSRVVTLGVQGRELSELGRTRDFGADESIYSTRFFGDRAYVVTFRQIDPLFVVDLSDPRAPEVVGQLHTPGYSNFLFPLPNDYLFGIGQEANAAGVVQGLALQIFDVRDPSAPSLAHKYVYPTHTWSDANIDFQAITFHPDRDLVSFPLQDYTAGLSSLEVFAVSTSSGFTPLGSVVPEAPPLTRDDCFLLLGYPTNPELLAQLEQDPSFLASLLEQCAYYSQPSVRRGLFRGDDVFAVTSRSVAAYSLDGLEGPPRSQVTLPPAYSYYYGGIPLSPVTDVSTEAPAAAPAETPSEEAGPETASGSSN